mgnify:CR=1 FL=1
MPRNLNGTYALVSGNPVVTGTVTSSDWANTTMPDLGSEMTDSLSRTGKGGMLAPVRGVNGSAAVPAHSFTNFVQSGMYMAGTGDLRLAVTGVNKLRLLAGDTRPQYWSVSGGAWLNVANSVDVTTLQANIDAEAATRASQTGANATAITANTSNITANASAITANASAITANTSDTATNTSNIAINTSDIAANDVDIALNTLAITLVGDIASIPARNTVLNQDPVSQGTSTRSGMSSTLYTGNSSTQSIATGIDMDTGDFGGLVWLKSRSQVAENYLQDTVRGAAKFIRSNATAAENNGANTVTSFDSTGFSVGSNVVFNGNTETYVAWSWQTTEKTTGTTNRGKAYTCHYNADLGFSIVGYEGDGVDGHEIPHYLGKEPELSIYKDRDAVNSWLVQSSLLGSNDFLYLNTTGAAAAGGAANSFYSPTTVQLDTAGDYNAVSSYVSYQFTSIPNVSKIGTYIGTGAAGNYVPCDFKVGWLLIKSLTSAGAWVIFDGSRGADKLLQPHLSSAEITGTTDIQFVDDGFVLTNTSSTTNTLNDQYIFMAYAEGTAFDSTKTLTNYPYATTDEVLTINEGTLMSFAEGFNAIGQANTQELVGAGVTLSFGTGYENQTRYVYKDKAGVYSSTQYRPLEGISRAQADKFGVVSPLDEATRTTDKHFGYESATGVALASGESSGFEAWKAFGKINVSASDSDTWRVASTTLSSLQYKFTEPRVLKSWRLRSPSNVNFDPKRFTIEGSNDGFVWTAIDGTYTAADYSGNGAYLWGGIQDTSANTVAYVYHRINITANNGNGTTTAIAELEFNTITPSDYYNVVDGLVYNNAGTVIDRVYLAKIMTGASGELLNYENLPVAKIKGVDAELQGDFVVHGEIKNRGVATARVSADNRVSPTSITGQYNVYDVLDVGTGRGVVFFETPMDSIDYVVVSSTFHTQANRIIPTIYNKTLISFEYGLVYDNNVYGNLGVELIVFGGKKIL